MPSDPEARGIVCRKCGCRHHYVRRTRPIDENKIMRLRECRNCGQQQITYEYPAGENHSPEIDDLTPAQRETIVQRIMGLFGVQ